MSLNFCQIQQLTSELAACECLENQCLHFFSLAIDLILFKRAYKEAMHNILGVFQFWPDWTRQHNYLPFSIQKYPNWVIMGKWCLNLFFVVYLLESYSKYWLSAERSLPLGQLVVNFVRIEEKTSLNIEKFHLSQK